MSTVLAERRTDTHEGPIVVLLIGLRVNRWWKPWVWLPVAMAMGKMLAELGADPEAGLLGYETWPGRTTLMVQYWRSHEQLQAYAHARSRAHVPAWARYAREVGDSGDVGVWHETYVVPAGGHESVYANMPAFGLGRAVGSTPATGRRHGALGRMEAAMGH